MAIGYACLTLGVENANLKKCTLKNVNNEKLENLIRHNLNSLNNIIDYNIENNIKLFRISSDIIPFGSSEVNKFNWQCFFAEELRVLGKKIKSKKIRVSMHPGQYTVLNSWNEDVVKRGILDLQYHADFLDCLNLDNSNKIILHIGGVYGDKKDAIKRFEDNYMSLKDSVKNRLVIENDDKSYNIREVLDIGNSLGIPVVYDNLHNKINCYDKSKDDYYWIKKAKKTWKSNDGTQKIHYSQQDKNKKAGSHSTTINLREFIEFYEGLEIKDIDIMLEVKDKNISAIKCINAITTHNIKVLEKEWERYKYLVLEHSQNNYKEIRKLLKDKNSYPVFEFYNLIEKAIDTKPTKGSCLNSTQHIWGYFKEKVSEKEKLKFLQEIQRFQDRGKNIKTLKNMLYKFSKKYNDEYVTKSYYFFDVYDKMWSNK